MLVGVVAVGNAAHTSLTGVGRVRATSNVTLANNAVLAEIGGLSDLEECGNLTAASNPALESLAFPGLVSAESFGVTGNTVLGELSLPALTSVTTSLTIAGNPALTTLGDLDGLASVGELVITGNSSLPQCLVDELGQRLGACADGCSGNDASATCD
jgi:hypothetical protein